MFRASKESCPEGVRAADYGTVSEAGPFISSLRQSRRENRWLFWALVVSLLVHLAIWGGYELGQRQGWWERWPVFAWLHRPVKPVQPPTPLTPLNPMEQEPQLSFVPVAEADAEAPKKPKFYSNNNSHAANETADLNLDNPKFNGKQTDAPMTQTAPRTHISKAQAQPTANPTKSQQESQPEKEQTQPLQPQPVVKAGDLAEGKPREMPQQTEPPHPQRPRTIREARAQLPSQLQGVQMHQEGGVPRVAPRPSFDAKATLFGDYDEQMSEAVQQKWDDLLDARHFSGDCKGRVTVHFFLNYDGSISEARIVPDQTTVDTTWALLCLEAITEPAPFSRWPDQMRREVGKNDREMTFDFHYY